MWEETGAHSENQCEHVEGKKINCELHTESVRVTTCTEMTVINTAVCVVEPQIATVNLSDCHTIGFNLDTEKSHELSETRALSGCAR